jgi:hypothetical protein
MTRAESKDEDESKAYNGAKSAKDDDDDEELLASAYALLFDDDDFNETLKRWGLDHCGCISWIADSWGWQS